MKCFEKESVRLLNVLEALKIGDKVHIIAYDGVDGHGIVTEKSKDRVTVKLHCYVMCHPCTSLLSEEIILKKSDFLPEMCIWHTLEIEKD